MRFVETKTADQQSGLVLHRTRHLCMRQQTSVINAIRAHLAEFGVVAPVAAIGVATFTTNASYERGGELVPGAHERATLSSIPVGNDVPRGW